MSDPHHDHDETLTITFNGEDRKFKYRPSEIVKALLDQALKEFQVGTNPHMMSLFKDGVELNDAQTLEQDGVQADDLLVLRQSTVKGGQ